MALQENKPSSSSHHPKESSDDQAEALISGKKLQDSDFSLDNAEP